MVTRRTGRPHGRPKLDFLKDPDRYRLVLIVATMEMHGLTFEAAARLALATEGRPASTGTLSRAAEKRLQQGWEVLSFKRIAPRQEIDSQIDNLRLKSKQITNNEPAQLWMHNMRNAWLNLLQHERVGPAAALLVFKCCEAAGESKYAKEFMLPFLRCLTPQPTA
jgi:hypothetical protein